MKSKKENSWISVLTRLQQQPVETKREYNIVAHSLINCNFLSHFQVSYLSWLVKQKFLVKQAQVVLCFVLLLSRYPDSRFVKHEHEW